MNVAEAFALTLETHYSSKQFENSSRRNEVKWLFQKHISPRLGSKKLKDLTPGVISKWHRGMDCIPFTANKAKSLLSTIFTTAALNDKIPLGINPCSIVPNFPEPRRRRYATNKELKQIKQLIDEEFKTGSEKAALFLYMLLYTGARPSAIERATFSNLTDNGSEGTLTFQGKSGVETVVLPPQVMEKVRKIHRNPYEKDQKIVGIKLPRKLWSKIQEEIGAPDLWARDLRRTFATVGMSGGVGIDQISKALSHNDTASTQRYALLNHDAQIKTANAIAEMIEKESA